LTPRAPVSTRIPSPTLFRSIRDIVEHPAGIVMLPESPPADQATGNVRIVNGVVQTGLNIARYEDGTMLVTGTSGAGKSFAVSYRSEEHTTELQSRRELVCRL